MDKPRNSFSIRKWKEQKKKKKKKQNLLLPDIEINMSGLDQTLGCMNINGNNLGSRATSEDENKKTDIVIHKRNKDNHTPKHHP